MKKFILALLILLLLATPVIADHTLTVTDNIELEGTELKYVPGRRISVDAVLKAIDEMDFDFKDDYRIYVSNLAANSGTLLGRAYTTNDIYLFVYSPIRRPDRVLPMEQYEVTIIHEIGHLVYYTLTDEQRIEYFEIRDLGDEYGDAERFPYRNRPSEIFAEDFRMLFGGETAKADCHINHWLDHPEEVVGLREFIKGLE